MESQSVWNLIFYVFTYCDYANHDMKIKRSNKESVLKALLRDILRYHILERKKYP